jgi:adenine-specific DNA methylase
MKKRFIEWDMPLAEISEASAREKSIRHGHPSTLHIWWARRPLASSRATNFAALIDLPEDNEKRKEITELIKKITPWEAVKNGNDANIKKAQQMIKEQWGDQPPMVLDPFAGGGSIPLEALRLGCGTYASDYNPVAVFIEKATLEWPQKFGVMIPNPDKDKKKAQTLEKLTGVKTEDEVNFLTYMVEKWANIILEQAKEEIGQFYPPDEDASIPVGYIWVRSIPCQNPSCGAEIPLVRQFWLAKKEKKKVAYKPVVDKEKKHIEFEIVEGDMDEFDPGVGTIARGNAVCPICEQVTEVKTIRTLAQNGQMGQRLAAVVLHNPGTTGKTYRIATKKDIHTFKEVEQYLQNKIESWRWLDSPLPDENIDMKSHAVNRLPMYGMKTWSDAFNSRQKLALITFMEKIKLAYEGIKEDCRNSEITKYGINPKEATNMVMGYLSLIFDRMLMFTNTLARWKPDAEATVDIFGRQALGMVWDYSENNPIFPHGGSFINQKDRIFHSLEGVYTGFNTSYTSNFSATSIPFSDNCFDLVITDPPYYDNVPYADLSDFFYVWLKRSVGGIFSDLFSTPLTQKSQEAIAEPARQENPKKFFEDTLSDSFKEVHRVLKPNGIATIVYAHKTTAGWETMLNSLVNAGLVITASWPIHTEMKTRLRAAASAALASSIYMVCRKTEREKVGFYSELQPQIKERVETKLQQFWNEGIAGGDFFISAIGPGMEIFSQYERVEKLSGEPVTTAELLDYIRSVSTDFIVRKLLSDAASSKIDNESEFYLAYRWTHLDNTVEYDDARKLASASGVSLEKLWGPGGFVKKSGSKISVLGPKERSEVDSIRSMVDVMHKTLLLWESGKKEELSELLAQTGNADNPAFKQFCQAVAETLLNGNKEKQLLEGFLIGIDTYAHGKVMADKAQTDLKHFGSR